MSLPLGASLFDQTCSWSIPVTHLVLFFLVDYKRRELLRNRDQVEVLIPPSGTNMFTLGSFYSVCIRGQAWRKKQAKWCRLHLWIERDITMYSRETISILCNITLNVSRGSKCRITRTLQIVFPSEMKKIPVLRVFDLYLYNNENWHWWKFLNRMYTLFFIRHEWGETYEMCIRERWEEEEGKWVKETIGRTLGWGLSWETTQSPFILQKAGYFLIAA